MANKVVYALAVLCFVTMANARAAPTLEKFKTEEEMARYVLRAVGKRAAGDTKQPIDYICEYGGPVFSTCAGELPEVCGVASAVCKVEKIKHFITSIFG